MSSNEKMCDCNQGRLPCTCKPQTVEQALSGHWVTCSPEWIKAGGNCATAPRILCGHGQGVSHMHPAHSGDSAKIADALEQCKWENVPIGNKAIIMAAVTALRADKPQGEPVALPERCDGSRKSAYYARGWNACLDEIAKLGPLYTRPVQGEPVAFVDSACLRNLRVSGFDSFSALLHSQQASMVSPQLVALYTHADPGEVERMRAEIERMRERVTPAHKSLIDKHAEIIKERDTLRAQLTETHKLLKWFASCADVRQVGAVAMQRVAALSVSAEPSKIGNPELSANEGPIPFPGYPPVPEDRKLPAEPSAPKCKTCHDQGEVFVRKGDVHCGMQTEPEPVMAACPECAEPSAPKRETCKSCHGEGVIHPGIEESPTTLCNRCDGSGNEPKPEACCGSCPAGCVISASEAKCETCDGHGAVGNILNAEPCPDCSYIAPVDRDERAAFEGWAHQNWPGAQRRQLERDGFGAYKNPCYRDFWTGWQARAALERKP